jgi:hypothetical protein
VFVTACKFAADQSRPSIGIPQKIFPELAERFFAFGFTAYAQHESISILLPSVDMRAHLLVRRRMSAELENTVELRSAAAAYRAAALRRVDYPLARSGLGGPFAEFR